MRRGGLKTHRNEVKRQGITSATSSKVRDALKDPEILLLLTVLEELSHVRKGVCDKRAPRSTVCEEESESNWIPAHVQVAPHLKATSRRRPSVGSISPSHEETHPLRRRNTRTSTTPGSAARGGHTEALAARRRTARPRVSSNEAAGSRRDPHPAASRAPGARPAQDPSTGPQHTGPSCLAGPRTQCPGRRGLCGKTGLFPLPRPTFHVPTACAEMTHGDDDTPWGEATPPTHTQTCGLPLPVHTLGAFPTGRRRD